MSRFLEASESGGEVGCYVLHLYCQNQECERPEYLGHPEFAEQTLAACRREAREAGWRRRGKRWFCPLCSSPQQQEPA